TDAAVSRDSSAPPASTLFPYTTLFRSRGDVAEFPAAQVLEQAVAVPHCGYEQIGIAVVVDVGERATHGDGVVHREARLIRDVREPTTPEVLPQLVGPELRDEVQVGEPVAIDVRRAQSRPVIIVDLLVRLARVVHHVVLEADAAGRSPVSEAKVVRDTRAGGQLAFLAGTPEQPRGRAR